MFALHVPSVCILATITSTPPGQLPDARYWSWSPPIPGEQVVCGGRKTLKIVRVTSKSGFVARIQVKKLSIESWAWFQFVGTGTHADAMLRKNVAPTTL